MLDLSNLFAFIQKQIPDNAPRRRDVELNKKIQQTVNHFFTFKLAKVSEAFPKSTRNPD